MAMLSRLLAASLLLAATGCAPVAGTPAPGPSAAVGAGRAGGLIGNDAGSLGSVGANGIIGPNGAAAQAKEGTTRQPGDAQPAACPASPAPQGSPCPAR